MIEWLQPFLLAGGAAVAAPLIVHLLQRRRLRRVDWGAMRFLQDLLARRRRRLLLEEILLLLLRMAILACIAAAMARPAFRPAASRGAVRRGGVASVLLIDNSLSSAAGRARPDMDAMKHLGEAYLDTLAPGDEVSVLALSESGDPAADPEFDLDAVRRRLASISPSHAASDLPALLEAGLDQLQRHINPSAELVVLTDGRADAWPRGRPAAWERVRRRLRGPADAPPGSRRRPRVITLAPSPEPAANVAVTSIALDRTLVTAGRPAAFRVRVENHGTAAAAVTVAAAVNGAPAGEVRVEAPAAGFAEASFSHVFPEPGGYAVEASLPGNRDALPADDRRTLAVEAEPPLPVLLVDGAGGAGLEGKLGFLQAALDPAGDGGGPFRTTRIAAAGATPSMIASNRVIVLGDVRALEPSLTDALERFVVGGGGLLAGLGPDSDPAFLNPHWAREGEGMLPCPVGAVAAPPSPVAPAAPPPGGPLFAGFGPWRDEAWKDARVRRYFRLIPGAASSPDFEPLLALGNGDPLLAERRRGLGLSAVWTSSLNAEWNELPAQAAFVPLMRALIGRLGGYIVPSRNIPPGGRLIEPRAGLADEPFTAKDPAGAPLPLAWGVFEGRGALVSGRLDTPGVYTVRFRGGAELRYAVAPAAAESALEPASEEQMAGALDGAATLLRRPEAVRRALEPGRRDSVEMWRWIAGAALLLLFVEAWAARRSPAAAGRAAETGLAGAAAA